MAKYKINYRLTTSNGELADKSNNFEFEVGDGQLAPVLEKYIIEAEINKLQTILLGGNEVFGEIDNEAIQTIDKKEMPSDIKIGSIVDFTTPNKHQVIGTVVKINTTKVMVDFNHPLAKCNIAFNFKVLEKF